MAVALIVTAGGVVVFAAAEAPDVRPSIMLPEIEKTDWNAFPGGYRALGNRYLIHPVDVGDWPLKLDTTRQLFIDDYLIAEKRRVRREFHRPVKHPKNPILKPELPWEKANLEGFGVNAVLRDEKTGRFRMWYYAVLPEGARFRMADGNWMRLPTCYAESDDGVHWVKPNIGKYELGGTKNNNIVHWAHLMSLFADPNEKDPSQRFKSIFSIDRPEPGMPLNGIYLHTSPDGFRWKPHSNWPIMVRKGVAMRSRYKGYLSPSRGLPMRMDEINNACVRFDRRLGKYVADLKLVLAGKRCVGLSVSDDLVHWSSPLLVMYPDRVDPKDTQFYFHHTFNYESLWLGLVRVMRTERSGWKQTDIHLTWSRNGVTWTRAGNREAFLPLGGPDSFDADYNHPAQNGKCLLVGDELWFYYMGSRDSRRDANKSKPKLMEGFRRTIGLATLRRDGFVSLNGGAKPGTILTRPISYAGKRLFVNADVSAGGRIRVEVRDLHNKPLAAYRLGDCSAIDRNTLRGPVVWGRTAELPVQRSPAIQEHVRLHFELTSAKLYSFWVE